MNTQTTNITQLYTPQKIEKTITTEKYTQKYVNTEETIKACKECQKYQNNWACPEFEDDTPNLWQQYQHIKLVLTKINFTQEAQNQTYNMKELTNIVDNTLWIEKNKLIRTLEQEEKQYNGRYLSAGYCNYCKTCERENNKACRHPDKCRCSIESIGGLVNKTLQGVFNEELKWINTQEGKLPTNLSLLMAILY